MNRLYDDYFKIEDNKPIREKVFLARIALSIGLIIVCLFAMGFAAYGFFAAELSSSSNVITPAYYTLDVALSEIPDNGGEASDEIFTPTSAGIYKLEAGKQYNLVLTKPTNDENIASTGFASISIYNTDSTAVSETYYTKPIGKILQRDSNGEPMVSENGDYLFEEVNERSYKIIVNEDAFLSIVPSWGNYSGTPFDESTITYGTPAVIDEPSEETEPNTETETVPNAETETEEETDQTESQPTATDIPVASSEEEQITE